jgi:hypothetical protein
LVLASAAGASCGDLGNVNIALTFPDDTTKAATRRLELIVRETPMTGDGCAALWSNMPTGLKERSAVIDYPNRNDVLGANVNLSEYPRLTMLVYAYAGLDLSTAPRIAGGCQVVQTNTGSDQNIIIKLQKPN